MATPRKRVTTECEAPPECFVCGIAVLCYAFWDAQGDDLLCTSCYRAEPESRLKQRYRRVALTEPAFKQPPPQQLRFVFHYEKIHLR